MRKVAWKDFYWVVRWVGLKELLLGVWKVLWKAVCWAGERDKIQVAWKGKRWVVRWVCVMVLWKAVRWAGERDVRKVAWKDFYWVVRWVGLKELLLGVWKVLWKDANLADVMGSRKAVQWVDEMDEIQVDWKGGHLDALMVDG